MNLADYVTERNADHAQTAVIQGGTGLGCLAACALFLFVIFVPIGASWFGYGNAVAFGLAATALYVGAAGWTAWRQGDPLGNLPRLTRAEASRREVEEAVADLVGGDALLALRRESIAGFGSALTTGPASLIAAWRSWSRRLVLTPELLARCQTLLEQASCEGGAPAGEDPQAALALIHLGLVRCEVGPDGGVVALATAKGKGIE